MSWEIEPRESLLVVRMNSNPVNKLNPAFFADLQQTFDRLDSEAPLTPIVLTGTGHTFSAGIDFDHSFRLFQGKRLDAVLDWFEEFRGAMLRVLVSERPTVAAVNGHAFAGGLILALCCDFRVAQAGNFRCGLNEVPVGIPMPSVYTELIRYRVGSRIATRAILTGEMFSVDSAQALGFYDSVAEPTSLLDDAVALASRVPSDCLKAYVHSKKMLLAPLLNTLEGGSKAMDLTTARLIMDEELGRAQTRSLESLKRNRKS